MGYSLSWLAIKGKTPQAVLDELGFRKTGEREEIPESALSSVELPTGWFLIVADHSEHVAPDCLMERLTAGCEAVTCFVEEHVMCCSSSGWKDGGRIWRVTHDVDSKKDNLEVEGEPPASFASIRDRWVSRQKEEDVRMAGVKRPLFPKRSVPIDQIGCDYIFEIPVDLARTLTGYQHDRDVPGLSGEVFEILEGKIAKNSPPGQKTSFWKKLFGA